MTEFKLVSVTFRSPHHLAPASFPSLWDHFLHYLKLQQNQTLALSLQWKHTFTLDYLENSYSSWNTQLEHFLFDILRCANDSGLWGPLSQDMPLFYAYLPVLHLLKQMAAFSTQMQASPFHFVHLFHFSIFSEGSNSLINICSMSEGKKRVVAFVMNC